MAEGGLPPELDLHLLECPICLERLQQPKSLPCIHSFCQDCLGTYITEELSGKMASATSFPCPVCRRMTHPVNQAETKDKWAEQFPTYSVIQDILQLRDRSSEPLYCKPCQTKGNITSPATFWCKAMDISFCETCKIQHHDILHKDCDILNVTGNQTKRPDKETYNPLCYKHGEKMVRYCEDHQLLCCNECGFEDHRRCEKVPKVTEYCQKLKAGSQLEDMKSALKKGTESMNSLVKDFDEQLQTMIQNQEIALQSISDLREKVDKRLDKLQKDITDELITLFKKEKRDMEATSQQCERLMHGMKNTLKSSIKSTEEYDNIETIVWYQRGQAEIESYTTLVTEISKSFTSVSIEHQLVPGRDIITDDAMGKIVVGKQPRCIPGSLRDLVNPMSERRVKEVGKIPIKSPSDKLIQRGQAEKESCKTLVTGISSSFKFVNIDHEIPGSHINLLKPLSERRVKEIGKFVNKSPSDKTSCYAIGVVYLPCAEIVINDFNNRKLKLFTDRGQYLDEWTLRGGLFDMCLVDNNTVAVADGGGVLVFKVEASRLSLTSEIKMPRNKNCYGITHANGKFVVSSMRGDVYSVTQDGAVDLLYKNNVQGIEQNPTMCWSLTHDIKKRDTIVSVSNNTPGDVAVYRLSADKRRTDVMKVGVVRESWGIDLDREGNIYVCGGKSNNVVQVSGDGTYVRELLTSSDGIRSPTAIAVCGDTFVITNISTTGENCICVYQLF